MPGTVWTCKLLGGPGEKGSRQAGPCKLAIGGEFETLGVYDVETCKLELQLPVDEVRTRARARARARTRARARARTLIQVVYEIALSPEALCFSHGRRCSLYGNGGAQYSWQDMPSYAVVQGLIKQMLSKPEELLKTPKPQP